MIPESAENASATSLKDFNSSLDSTLRPYSTLIGHNLGNLGVIATVPMHQFHNMSAVANEVGLSEAGMDGEPVAQRKLDPKHAQKLALYMLRGLVGAVYMDATESGKQADDDLIRIREELGRQPYFSLQPIVVNIRTCGPAGAGLHFEKIGPGYVKVYLSDRDTLWVVDGQHRRYGMDILFEFLDSVQKTRAYPKRGAALYKPTSGSFDATPGEMAVWKQVFEHARQKCTVVLDIHLGLKADQERQLFHDLNNLGKKVEANLAFQFDDSNPINLFIKDELIDRKILGCEIVDRDDLRNWHEDEGVLARKEIISVCARLFLNKTTVSGTKPQDIQGKTDVAKEFWEAVSSIPHFGEPGAKKKTVAAQPVILKALAKLTYDFAFGREQDPQILNRLLQGIADIDFSHTNPMWRYYELLNPERVKYGLTGMSAYLPADDSGANRDIGKWTDSESVMRFGAKHNDIFPILADMIRWKLQLPNRHS